MKRNT